jgi:uncharacterized membrane protein YqgA involved in biofilm formation
MSTLLFFDFCGFLVCFLAHLCLLLGFSLPSGKMAVVLNIGIGVAVGTRLAITKQLRQGKDWFYDKSLKGVGPLWLKVVTSLLVIYGIVNCIYSVVKIYSMISVEFTKESSVIASRKLYIGVFAMIMACYACEFLFTYLYKILNAEQLKQSESKGITW